jgi:acyl-CoA thioesterase-1
MSLPPRFPFRIAVVMPLAAASAVAASMVAGFAPIPASAQAATYACADKAAVTRLSYPLSHMAQRIAARHSVTIVALGSSSTAGAGASGPAASYPNRLEAELKARFPGLAITVLNRGVNGDVAADMLAL